MVFPPASETLSWKAFARKVEMVGKWLELIERASGRIVGLYSEPGNLAEEVLTKLLGLSCAFWAWDDHETRDDATYTPFYMREKTLKVMLTVVLALGDNVTTAPSDRRLWQTLRMFLVECLDIVRDFASSPTPLIPSSVKLFKDASLSQSVVTPFEIKLHSSPYFDAFLLSGIEAVSQALCLPIRSKWLHTGFCGPLKALPYRLLRYHLRSPDLGETELNVINEVQAVIPAFRTDIVSALEMIRLERLEEKKARNLVRSKTMANTPEDCFTTEAVTALNLGPRHNDVLAKLEKRRNSIATTNVDDKANRSMIWMQKVRDLVQDLCFPDQLLWSDDEYSAPDDQFTSLVLHRLRECSQRPLLQTDSPVRVSYAKKLATLVQSLPMLSFALDRIMRLIHGPDNEVTSELRRLAFAALTRVIRHHSIKEDRETIDGTFDFIFHGLTDRERSVRLGAGNALAALLHIMGANRLNIESIFDRLYRLFDAVKIPVKESLIISVGQVGKSPEMEVVGQSLCFLLAQLDNQNPVLKGSAYMKSIARVLEVPVSALYLQEAPQILAHVFQLQGPGQTRKAVEFIERMVAADLPGSITVTIQDLLKSSQVQTLAEIIIELGNAHKAHAALAALNKMQQLLGPAKQNRSQDLANFLKPHTLGVFSQLSDFLQEVKVKVSIERKQTILRSMGALARHVGRAISDYAPQYMSTFQTMVIVEELSEVTLETWHIFLTMLEPDEIKPYVGPTTAAFIFSWRTFNTNARSFALRSLEYLILEIGKQLDKNLNDVVDLSPIPELTHLHKRLKDLRRHWTPEEHIGRILSHCISDNLTVAVLSIDELKRFLATETQLIHQFASGDVFDPTVGQIMTTLIAVSCRDGDGTEPLRLLAFECIGILGALDPDRLEINVQDPSMIVLNNFMDEEEAILFAMHLIRDLLVGVFRATNDVVYQRYLGFTLQELLRVCHFTPSLIGSGNGAPPSTKVRNRWKSLPKHVVETLISLLDSKYSFHPSPVVQTEHPIYPTQSTYREWIQIWTCHLIDKASGPTARNIFASFPPTVRNKDVVVAYHILPHLVLNILISGHDDDAEAIRIELKNVLEDQINPDSSSTPDKKLLSAQAVFMIMDHINKWVRIVRQNIGKRKSESKRARDNQIDSKMEEQLLRVDSILSSIDQILIARAAFECKAYARSLMSFERQIVALHEQSPNNKDLPGYYERLHEIYSHLDEPDGMEGVSTLILSPSLEHQIRQHESTGRWTSAQSCWEVRLQQSPDNVDFHIGLLRCLRNLGHYDTLRTHVKGVLIRHPEWEVALAGFHVESAWMVGAWGEVQEMVERTSAQSSSIVMARLLLAMRADDSEEITKSISVARSVMGAPITAAGIRGYRRSYEAILDLHLMHELETIQDVLTHLPSSSQEQSQNHRRRALVSLSEKLAARFESTLPTFRTREPILSLRRTAFSLSSVPRQTLACEHGRSWLTSAAIARKAGHWQTAYSAMLQATQNKTKFSFFESAKLIKALGEPLRALTELENSMRSLGMLEGSSNVVDLTQDEDEIRSMKAKAIQL
ncbi:hypothetical protein C0993_007327 [Termitomyces sp. T159_Od127]|nr:hypothetical protein C0993_007327 [Termitomyces sp. T159_Od127]